MNTPEMAGTKETVGSLKNRAEPGKRDSEAVNGETMQPNAKALFKNRFAKGERTTAATSARLESYRNFIRTPSTGQRARTLIESGYAAKRSAGMNGKGLPE